MSFYLQYLDLDVDKLFKNILGKTNSGVSKISFTIRRFDLKNVADEHPATRKSHSALQHSDSRLRPGFHHEVKWLDICSHKDTSSTTVHFQGNPPSRTYRNGRTQEVRLTMYLVFYCPTKMMIADC